jgi:hypothetical protein
MPSTWFGHYCGQPPNGRCIAKDGCIEILQKFVNQFTDAKYCVVTMYALKYILKCNL